MSKVTNHERDAKIYAPTAPNIFIFMFSK